MFWVLFFFKQTILIVSPHIITSRRLMHSNRIQMYRWSRVRIGHAATCCAVWWQSAVFWLRARGSSTKNQAKLNTWGSHGLSFDLCPCDFLINITFVGLCDIHDVVGYITTSELTAPWNLYQWKMSFPSKQPYTVKHLKGLHISGRNVLYVVYMCTYTTARLNARICITSI